MAQEGAKYESISTSCVKNPSPPQNSIFCQEQNIEEIVIEELTLDTIDAIIEYDGYVYGTSNVQKVLDFLEKKSEKQDDPAAPAVSFFDTISGLVLMKSEEFQNLECTNTPGFF